MLEGVVLKMFCSRCGHKVNDEAEFCPICGARIVDNAPGVRVGRGNEGAPSSEEAPLQGAGNGATLRNTRDEACNREVAHGIQPKNKGVKKLVVALAAVLVAGTGGYAIWQAKPSAPRASQVKADTAGGSAESSDTRSAGRSETAKERTKSERFLSKLDELERSHGGTAFRARVDGESGTTASSAGFGVCYAEMVRFGDGVERLVVVYATEEWAQTFDSDFDAGPSDGSYVLEVYEYDDGSEGVELAYSSQLALPSWGQGYPFITWINLTDAEEGPRILEIYGCTEKGEEPKSCYLGAEDDSTFGEMSFAFSDDSYVSMTYYSLYESGTLADDSSSGSFTEYNDGGHALVHKNVRDTRQTVEATEELLGSQSLL